MSELLTMQDLANGHLDIKALGEAANGDENTIVTTRTGNTYPSAERAINIMFKNGGLPATPFASKALMTASALVDGQYAMVTDDTVNNGLYVKTAGAWVKSAYDPLTQAKADATTKANAAEVEAIEYADSLVDGFFTKNTGGDLIQFTDDAGGIYAKFDESGGFHLVGIEGTVQDAMQDITQKIPSFATTNNDSDIVRLIDKDSSLVARVSNSGELFLTGLDKSVQKSVLESSKDIKLSTPKPYKTFADFPTADSASYLSQHDSKIPDSHSFLPHRYNIGSNWLSDISAPVSGNRIVIGAYNDRGTATNWVADSGVVHPCLVKFNTPFLGYKYWLSINPYTGTTEDFELPYIYGSNSESLDDWQLIEGLPQPFDIDPENTEGVTSGFLSDTSITYDPINDELWIFWRRTLYYDDRDKATAKHGFYARSSKDGVEWSDIKELYPAYTLGSNDSRLSPSIVFNPSDGLFYLYYVKNNGLIAFETTDSLDNANWSEPYNISTPTKGWHMDVRWVGGSVVALLQSDTEDKLFVGVSNNMKDFEWSGSVFGDTTPLYKATFLPMFNDNGEISLRIIYTTDQQTSPSWQLHQTQTNFISVGA